MTSIQNNLYKLVNVYAFADLFYHLSFDKSNTPVLEFDSLSDPSSWFLCDAAIDITGETTRLDAFEVTDNSLSFDDTKVEGLSDIVAAVVRKVSTAWYGHTAGGKVKHENGKLAPLSEVTTEGKGAPPITLRLKTLSSLHQKLRPLLKRDSVLLLLLPLPLPGHVTSGGTTNFTGRVKGPVG